MASSHFYFQLNTQIDLKKIAQTIVQLFGEGKAELRESSNYLNDEYFRMEINSSILTLALCDDVDAGAYQYWLEVEPASRKLIQELQRQLASQKIKIAEVINFGKKNQTIVPII